jgi:redox-sensitive bicupin YhaK (pirin superfamily)
VLPSPHLRNIGPFVFVDHMGPAVFPPGAGIDVRPHPHIGLATVTYLFEGEIDHRDSLGVHQAIRPGAVNWMTAGHGIVHSERTGSDTRAAGHTLHGMQVWVALPKDHEDSEPQFFHHAAGSFPEFAHDDAQLTLLLGEAYGQSSPVAVHSPIFYLEARLPAGGSLRLPDGHAERAVYVAEGEMEQGGETIGVGQLAVYAPGGTPRIRATTDCRIMLLGGAPLDGPRTVYWNLVSSDPAKIERAKLRWANREFPTVPGDEDEFIPLPAD